jgi:hypothetical protein
MTRRHMALFVFMLVIAGGQSRPCAAQTPREYDVKAAFLLNFTRFIEWPNPAFADARAPIEVCLFESNPFGGALQQALQGETAGGRPLVVRQVATAPEIGSCHLFFIPSGSESRALRLLELTQTWAVSVGESRRFLALGGAINLFLEGGRVRFSVNLRPVDRRGIRISARMLQLASEVQGAGVAR